MTQIQITERHMVGGKLHEHIAEVKWRNTSDGNTGASSRATMVVERPGFDGGSLARIP